LRGRFPDPYQSLVLFLGFAGPRIGEASALRVKNLDLTARTVRVVENSPEVGGRSTSGPRRPPRRARYGLALDWRESSRRISPPSAPRLTPIRSRSRARKGSRPDRTNFRKRIFQPAAKRAGIDPVPTVHDLRHTAASLMARACFSLRDAQEQLGHSHATMTDRYTHLFPEDREQKVAALDALLSTETA
jgi:integrase